MVTDSTSLYYTQISATPISQFPSPATWLVWQNVGNLASFVFYFDFFTLTRQNVLYKMIFEIDFMSKIFYLTISDNPTVSKKKKKKIEGTYHRGNIPSSSMLRFLNGIVSVYLALPFSFIIRSHLLKFLSYILWHERLITLKTMWVSKIYIL